MLECRSTYPTVSATVLYIRSRKSAVFRKLRLLLFHLPSSVCRKRIPFEVQHSPCEAVQVRPSNLCCKWHTSFCNAQHPNRCKDGNMQKAALKTNDATNTDLEVLLDLNS